MEVWKMQLDKRELTLLGLASILIGFLFIVLFKAEGVTGSQGARQDTSVPSLIQTEKENQQLSNDNEKIQQELDKFAQGQSASALANRQLQEAKMYTGLVAVTGPGIWITLDDSKSISKEVDINNYIHEQYITAILNALWNGGAEAIAVNDQRVMANTEVFCAGSYIQINGTRQMPPYVIKAIGDTNNLSSALNFQYTWLRLGDYQKQYGITRKLEVLEKVMIPAGKLRDYHYAEPVKEGT
jgi:uncharacterized protein YlxW (UPF0749 family)